MDGAIDFSVPNNHIDIFEGSQFFVWNLLLLLLISCQDLAFLSLL